MTGSCSAYDCSGESLLESGSGDYYDYVDIDRCGRGCGGGGVGNKASPQKPKPILQAGTSSPELEDSGMVSGIEGMRWSRVITIHKVQVPPDFQPPTTRSRSR